MTDLSCTRATRRAKAPTPCSAEARSPKTMFCVGDVEDRFLCGFGHIFAGGYSAGYYSYPGRRC